jgi:hypothetical protein
MRAIVVFHICGRSASAPFWRQEDHEASSFFGGDDAGFALKECDEISVIRARLDSVLLWG